ncbi:MAG TPA: hypothetical protein VKX17_18120 [Planctomycetota bacterium]|nr:hypothetical protein [Planctomycetota bacterium]
MKASSPILSVALVLASLSASALELNGLELAATVGTPSAPRAEPIKQPVFLFCPHQEGAGAWSLYVLADKNDPSKILALGLEELAGKNSKEFTYKGVLKAQQDPATPRHQLAHLDAQDFAAGRLAGKDLLSIKAQPAPDGLKLTIDARVSSSGHFIVGGAEQSHRDAVLKYSSVYKCWQVKAPKLENTVGENAAAKHPLTLTGIVFTYSTLLVSRICAVDEFGTAVLLMDR